MVGVPDLDHDSGSLLILSKVWVDRVLYLPASVMCLRERAESGRRGCADGDRRIAVPAAAERAAGHDGNARQVLIAQQEDLRRRAPDAFEGRVARWRHWLWGWLGRYGYRAHRLVTALVVVLALTGALAYAAGQVPTRAGHHAAERVVSTTDGGRGTPCSTAELIGLGIDRGLPLGATGLRARCDLDTATRRGQAFTYLLWALQALLWAMATLAVAAYTGLVRKPT
ncbi:hypothetical protein EKG83_23040 [Saccharothrix syringae]|uniref:Uncharacterized protein n=1 Tax=Saccharothrix syringae TaxID=103733 RepID=A0A5Q0H271_SACSY|nr:hypothetical protein EKG83_23040 [Saccharothrix syringae]